MVWKDPFKGVKSDVIMDTDLATLNSWDRRTIARAVRRLSDTANKRLRAFQEKGVESPAFINAMRSGGKFTTRGKTINQLRSEFIRARNFLRMKTSTQKGYTKFKTDFLDRVEATTTQRMILDDDALNKFWHAYDILQPEVAKFVKGSEEQQKYVYDVFVQDISLDEDKLVEKLRKELGLTYEEKQGKELSGIDFYSVMN